ncbi:MAG: DUF47 domain-containing protein [Coriobacteriales bacterium]
MQKRDGFDYFDSFSKQAAFALEMALNLESAIGAGELGTHELVQALHTIENDADQVNHEIQAHLLSDFVVPMEREGLGSLAHALDDVSDAIEEVALKAYIYGFTACGEQGTLMISMLSGACKTLKVAADDLAAYQKKSAEIKKRLVQVQTYESECDGIYVEAAHGLYADESLEAEQRRIMHSMLKSVEDAMDAVENAAERIESIVAENF